MTILLSYTGEVGFSNENCENKIVKIFSYECIYEYIFRWKLYKCILYLKHWICEWIPRSWGNPNGLLNGAVHRVTRAQITYSVDWWRTKCSEGPDNLVLKRPIKWWKEEVDAFIMVNMAFQMEINGPNDGEILLKTSHI